MRQRNLKSKEQINTENERFIVKNPKEQKGRWGELFGENRKDLPLYIEIGSGKGQFITGMAEKHPDCNYLACEGAINVYPRILQKYGAMDIPNALLITEYIINPADYFEPGELAGVYLNFSDPWRKARLAHRRLTHVDKLKTYKEILTGGATLEFKTDDNALFDWSLEQADLADLNFDYITRDLHQSPLASENVLTEYEEKFAGQGRQINYFRIVFK